MNFAIVIGQAMMWTIQCLSNHILIPHYVIDPEDDADRRAPVSNRHHVFDEREA
jgi:hypothetical protein